MISKILILPLAALALQAAPGILTWSSYLGGDGVDIIHAIAIDASNNLYLTGETLSSNFPVTSAAFQKKHGGTPGTITGILAASPAVPDAFVVKLNPAGQIVYATYLGGVGSDAGLGIAVDSSGSAYVVGTTTSANFPVTAGAIQTKLAGGTDVFVAKLSPDGSTLAWATFLGGSGFDSASAIAVDSSGNAFVGGMGSADFPVTSGAYQAGGGGAFAAKVNSSGTGLSYSTFLGDKLTGTATGITPDANGNAYVLGTTSSSEFIVTPGALHSVVAAGKSAVFLVKLNGAGSGALYAALLGGDGDSFSAGLAVDSQGNAYLDGSSDAVNFPVTAAAFRQHRAGSADVFVTKVNSTGSSLIYGALLGGSGVDRAAALAIDSAGNAFIAGSTFSTAFPVTSDALPKRFAGSPCLLTGGSPFGSSPVPTPCGDAFAAKIDTSGSTLLYSTYFSGSDVDLATAIAVNTDGALVAAGQTRSGNIPIAGASFQDTRYPAACSVVNSPSSAQSYPCEDGFIAKIDFSTVAPPGVKVANFGSLLDVPVAPAEVVTIFGSSIGPASPATLQLDSANRIVTMLAGTQVLFDGVPAPLVRVDSTQITTIVPHSVTGKGHSIVTVRRDGATTASSTVVIGSSSPALLTLDPSGTGPCAAVNPDGSLNGAATPAAAGSIVSLYMVGVPGPGQVDGALAATATNLSPTPVVVIRVQLAQVLYAGPSPGSTEALTQVNVRLPAALTGQVPVFVLTAGFSSQAGVTLFTR